MTFRANLPPVSTRSDWTQSFRLRARDTGDLIDLTGCSITLRLDRDSDRGCSPYSSLIASTGTGEITIPGIGIFTVSYLASQATPFNSLRSGNYRVTVILSRDGATTELICGTLPIRGS